MTELPRTAPPSAIPALPAVDLYGAVHRGLRRELCKLLDRMGTTSLEDAAGWTSLTTSLEELLALLEHHFHHEADHLHAALAQHDAGAAAALEREHAEHLAFHAELRTLVRAVHARGEPGTRRALFLRYGAYVGASLVHMTDEELRVQALLDETCTADELQALEQRLLASIPPPVMFAFMCIMLPAQPPEVRAGMLAQARTGMPPQAFAALTDTLARAA
ncbi:MAG TPA: hemerythrin domain-containing protein [Kofleriaceae bacterium]|nr:hemerythrin domain-containing protein [Kofleriaceae bacterium]